MNRLFSIEMRNKFNSLFRITSYLGHPEMKTLNPKKRWKMLLTMRDLRLWIIENAPFSSRADKHHDQLEAIIREINYLQFRGNFAFRKNYSLELQHKINKLKSFQLNKRTFLIFHI